MESGSGNDTLIGGAGDDTYMFGRGGDQDTVDNTGRSADSDKVQFYDDVAYDQLWFRKDGDDLRVDIVETQDVVRVKDWFQEGTGADNRLDFRSGDGRGLTAARVQSLVNAMAAFDPPATDGPANISGQTRTQLQTALAAAWQPVQAAPSA